ncbi:MAG: hypothetical protein SFV15_24265 [Polyangiaceae bacterium]|nr:hypothetical protein [Polyangiaceae bacterium]
MFETRRILQAERLARRLQKQIRDLRGTGYVYDRVDEYRALWRAVATAVHAEFLELGPDIWELRRGQQRLRLVGELLPIDHPVVLELAVRKPLVHRLLQAEGLPVPAHLAFDLNQLDAARSFLAKHALGCVIKPADGYGGQGVTLHVTEPAQVRPAAVLASIHGQQLMIEEMIPGECFRLLVFDGRLVHTRRRTGLRLRADGHTRVETLLEQAGIPKDANCDFTLRAQKLDLSSVPAPGSVLARGIPSAERVGPSLRTVYDYTVNHVHPSLVKQVEQAAQVVGSRLLGVDVITTDIELPLAETRGAINEVNTTPGMHHHYDRGRELYPMPVIQIIERLLVESRT